MSAHLHFNSSNHPSIRVGRRKPHPDLHLAHVVLSTPPRPTAKTRRSQLPTPGGENIEFAPRPPSPGHRGTHPMPLQRRRNSRGSPGYVPSLRVNAVVTAGCRPVCYPRGACQAQVGLTRYESGAAGLDWTPGSPCGLVKNAALQLPNSVCIMTLYEGRFGIITFSVSLL
ncbi:hypothetical protein BGZ61DRAFT_478496 [Ilyonectria robusta]|uniref:uncharacterized protein n=1 Tax=Ilyonectria robusta TaxID=1079257 RepID=UPI001E8D0165|nr:uncharacterized protein BGZ61DRAFT_478496 [Ilyonectria robusta]KAH8688150.1 hypothetical protein BGZ61DRAFT_478496 [Ilyonectria robusta]